MGLEIERKYLVTSDAWRAGASGTVYRQGYLSTEPGRTVRVRLAGEKAYLTIKGAAVGLARPEFEYAIPPADAADLLAMCPGPLIEKTRYRVPYEGHTWEIDEFFGANAGLIVAEIELASEDENFVLPPWAGQDVTNDRRYYNSSLSQHPWNTWSQEVQDLVRSGLLAGPGEE